MNNPEPIILNHRYQLDAQIGKGGMATVFRARDLMLERIVAIKVLHQNFSNDLQFRDRFQHEAKAAANLTHPNIATVHDFGDDGQTYFIVMEYVPGTDLKSILKQQGRLSIQQTLDLMIQACAGIGYAHRAGLVHCDIKPQNMLITPDKHLKMVDFGIARALTSISPDEHSDIVWGSPQYFSPEQAKGIAPSPASDVYSLGIVMFEMLTGQLPFNGGSAEELARQHREQRPPSPRSLNPDIPTSLEQTIRKVLAKETSARFQTAGQFGRVLASISNQPLPKTATTAQQNAIPSYTPSSLAPPQPVIETFPQVHNPVVEPISPPRSDKIDWITPLLALLAFIALLGLIPFWLWVYVVLNPPL